MYKQPSLGKTSFINEQRCNYSLFPFTSYVMCFLLSPLFFFILLSFFIALYLPLLYIVIYSLQILVRENSLHNNNIFSMISLHVSFIVSSPSDTYGIISFNLKAFPFVIANRLARLSGFEYTYIAHLCHNWIILNTIL